MQIAPGMIVDLRYYGAQDQVSSIQGKIVDLDQVGIVIMPNDSLAELFPWSSVQRVIVTVSNGSVS